MRLRITTILLTMLLSGVAIGSEKEIWACRTTTPDSRPILHLVEWGSKSYVKFANARLSARHEVTDEDRGWYWGNEGGGYYRYGLVLESDGKAWFHDFAVKDDDGLSPPLDHFSCLKTG